MLIHLSSGACELFDELFHGLYCCGSMRVGVTLWFGWGGVVSVCRLQPASRQLCLPILCSVVASRSANALPRQICNFRQDCFCVQTVCQSAYRSVTVHTNAMYCSYNQFRWWIHCNMADLCGKDVAMFLFISISY